MEIRGHLELADAIGSEVPDGHVADINSLEVTLYLLLRDVLMEYKWTESILYFKSLPNISLMENSILVIYGFFGWGGLLMQLSHLYFVSYFSVIVLSNSQ